MVIHRSIWMMLEIGLLWIIQTSPCLCLFTYLPYIAKGAI